MGAQELSYQITDKCFFDIEIDEKPMGRIVRGFLVQR